MALEKRAFDGDLCTMLNQLIRIQIRNSGLIAFGCPIDGLVGAVITLWQRLCDLFVDIDPRLLQDDRHHTFLGTGAGVQKRLHRLRYWQQQHNGMALLQG